MPITYDSGTNRITITGYTEESPCTFEDVYQADQANGWGKVEKTADHSYVINCCIRIGNGSAETWFADENKQVNFLAEDFVTGNGNYIFQITNHAHARFGRVIDETSKSTGHGCQFIVQNNVPYWLRFLFSSGELRLYSTSVVLTDYHDIMGTCQSTSYESRIWNCIFENSFHFSFTRNTDIFNLTVINSSTFLRRPDSTTTVNHCVGLGCNKGVWFQGMGGSVKDVYGRNIGRAIYISDLDENDTDCYVINGDFDNWASRWKNTISERKLFRQYTVNLKVVDKNGNPIQGAIVELQDKNKNTVFSELTDAEGKISEQTVTYGYYQRDGDGYFEHDEIFTSMSPCCLHVSKIGYWPYPYTVQFELDCEIDWLIALKKNSRSELSPWIKTKK